MEANTPTVTMPAVGFGMHDSLHHFPPGHRAYRRSAAVIGGDKGLAEYEPS